MLKDSKEHIGFKNEISRRFYEWCKVLIDSKELTSARLAEVLGKYEGNPSRILSELKSGKLAVTVEWITACQEKLGLNPGVLFGNAGNTTTTHTGSPFAKKVEAAKGYVDDSDETLHLVEDKMSFGVDADKPHSPDPYVSHVSSEAARYVHNLLQKHNVKIEPYARQQLGISRQQYYQYVNGNSRLPFDVVQRVCEDMGESLDQFRTRPLPQGHLLDRIKHLSELVQAKDELIELLKKQRSPV